MTTVQTHSQTHLSHLTFGGVLRSEWIKLRTLRSTMWCYLIVIVVTIGLGLLLSTVHIPRSTFPADAQRDFAVRAITAGTSLSSLIVAVLGALMITGEYGTGMIRSTLAAVPKRIPALVAKALVFGVTTFVVAAVSIAVTALIVSPLLPGVGVHVNLVDSRILLPLLGNAGYLALLGMFALFVGALVRSSAGGIAVALGVVLVVPIILSIVAGVTQTIWPSNLNDILPSGAGDEMYAYVTSPAAPVASGAFSIDPSLATFIMIGWVVVLFVFSAILLKRRDA